MNRNDARNCRKGRAIHPQVGIGHAHLKVADLERALTCSCGVRGFATTPEPLAQPDTGPRIQQVFEDRAQLCGQSVEAVKQASMSNQSIKRLVDPPDIAVLAVFLASDHGKSISGQMLPIDNDMQQAS